MEEFDTIIIGSGAGGLSAAICLARAGQRVVVLEQHYVPGGWCHSFYRNGHRFSPGVHYLGMMDKGESTSSLYEGLGIANDLVFFRMNPAGYEHCWIGEERIDMPAGIDQLYESLSNRFPTEKTGLKKYLKVVRDVSRQLQLIPKMNGFWDNVLIPYRTRHLGKYGLFSLKKVLDWHIKDPLLKKVLNVQCGDHGLPPAQASFPLHCAVMDHYFDGGFYPMGGGGAIVKAMTNAIKRHGGQIRTGQGVKRILLEGDKKLRAVGVELNNGEQIRAKRIVSNADPDKTYLDMIGADNLSQKLRDKLAKTRYSVTSLIFFLTVDVDVRKAGMDSGNIWMLRNQDLDQLFGAMTAKDILAEDEFPALFISCTTLKDPASYNGRHHNIEVVTLIDYESFREFNQTADARSQAYLQHKERICQKLLNSLDRVVPNIRDHVVQMELGTPITSEFYINSTKGNAYGTEKSFRQTGPFAFNKKSEIENLYLCGASILSHGVAGASNSGVQTAAAILHCQADELIKPEAGQHVRIYDAEDNTHWPAWIHQKMADKKSHLKEMAVLKA
ncbi:MAG: NAD(P)/FAD-dependent oxidoreductase [Bacteroidota bacterium]